MKKLSKLSTSLYIFLCFAFLYIPIIVTMVFSFNSTKSFTKFSGFSMQWYEQLVNDSEIMSAVWVSVSVAIIATVVSTILGTITAIGLSKCRRLLKEWILNVNNIPIMNPDIVTAIGLMILFTSLKIEKGYITMLLAHICFCTPYVITSVYPKVRALDVNVANAALDLGATPFQALIKVIVPMLKPGIYAGMLLAFTMSIDDFVISYFVSGNGVKNISIIVYNATKRINPTINALSTIVILVIVTAVLIVNLAPRLKNHQWFIRLKEKISPGVKRTFTIITSLLLCFLMIFSVIRSNSSTNVLKVYNAGEYIDYALVEQFEAENNCKIVYETFDSNESLYTKMMSGERYDIIVPSDYMIERLAKEGYLQKIDKSKLKNLDNVIPYLMNKPFDPGNEYSVPYFWGNVGILYDKTVVSEEDLKAGWEVLRNPKFKGNLYMYNSERDSFMIALKALGCSLNTTDKGELYKAYEWLVDQRNKMDPVYVGDEVIDSMISGNKALAIVYSGDAAYIMSENENLEFFTPDDGTNTWIDGMVITSDCKNVDLAHKWIDFMLENESAKANTIEIGYSSPVEAVFYEISETEYDGISAYVPRLDNPNDEFFGYQPQEIKQYCAELWIKVKAD